jgi:leucyl aminopeptidase
MNYTISQDLSVIDNECLVVGLWANAPLPECLHNLPKIAQMTIAHLQQHVHKAHALAWQTEFHDHQLLVIHCGTPEEYTPERMDKLVHDITHALLKQRVSSATIYLPPVAQHTPAAQLERILTRVDAACYQLLTFKHDDSLQHVLSTVNFLIPGTTHADLEPARAIANGVNLTRTLANLPANICTPSYLAETAMALDTDYKSITTTILHQADLEALKMGAFLAVAKGSHESPKLVQVHYMGAQKQAPIILVGKGITFDSGGISIKPANGMEEMKYDMAGAASVLGTIKACAEMKLPINVMGLLACAENMPGGHATRPGDIVTTMSGKSVEIVNTDAEGRLVLADTLTYAEQFKPRFVIDIATLTGAIIVALGHVHSGLMTTDESLAELILTSAQQTGDKAWRMPLEAAYDDALDSPLADLVNAGFDRSAGSVTAACFLARFTQSYPWAHLDIAGTAWTSGKKNHATGRPVPLLIGLLRHVAHSR